MKSANEISEMIRSLPNGEKQRLIELIWLLYRAPDDARDAAIAEIETMLHRKALSSAQLLRKVKSVTAQLQACVGAAGRDGDTGTTRPQAK